MHACVCGRGRETIGRENFIVVGVEKEEGDLC